MMKKNSQGQWEEDPIHSWFGLSYSNYFVMPRMVLQSMPIEWQKRFIHLIDELNDTGIEIPNYHVLRDEDQYTYIEKSDKDDEYSNVESLTILRSDPFSNYRHPDYNLLPEVLRPIKQEHIK